MGPSPLFYPFPFLLWQGSHDVAQAGHEIDGSSDLPASASWGAGTTNVL